MNPAIIAIAAVTGLVVISKSVETAKLPQTSLGNSAPVTQAWPSWLGIGSQQATGNGQSPSDTATTIATTVGNVAKFGASLFDFFNVPSSDGGGGSYDDASGSASTDDW